jgi:hypothetical protein
VTARAHRVSTLARAGLPALPILPLLAALLLAAAGTAATVRAAGSPAMAVPAAPGPAKGLPATSAGPALAVPPSSAQSAASAVQQDAVRDGPEALAAVRRLLAAGAPALALMRIERAQAPGPRWAEWEALRIGVLAETGAWPQLAARADALSGASPLPGGFLRATWLAGAEAALRMPGASSPALARALAARVVWASTPTPDELRRAQAAVIESLYVGGDAPAGYRSILRFRQDVPAPGILASARFVALIAAHGAAADAVPLLPLLPDTHPVRIAAQAQLGLVPPATAAAQARAALRAPAPASGATADAMRDWQALRIAARAIGEPLLVVEASERLLDADPAAAGAVPVARQSWRDYLVAAPAVANREQLLVGDAFAWSDAAARLAARDPAAARTLFAFLSVEAPEPAVRATARLQFASLLREAGLGRAAVRLFLDREAMDPSSFGPDLRRLLADTAAARRMWGAAADFRRGLDPRPGEDADAWRMAEAEWLAKAGRFDGAVTGALAALGRAGRADLRARALALADLLADAGDAAAAARVREAAGPAPVPAPAQPGAPASRAPGATGATRGP